MISAQILQNILQTMLNVGLIVSIVLLQRRVTKLEDKD